MTRKKMNNEPVPVWHMCDPTTGCLSINTTKIKWVSAFLSFVSLFFLIIDHTIDGLDDVVLMRTINYRWHYHLRRAKMNEWMNE